MKEKILQEMPEAMFCPNCHKKIDSPIAGFKNVKITGSIRIQCGQCKNGMIIIKDKEK